MNSLIFALAYCQKDAESARQLFDWIHDLGGCPGHSCLLTVDSKVDSRTSAFIKMIAQNSFDHVQEIIFTEPPPPKVLRWPLWRYFANQMFLKTAQHVSDNCRLPFMWGESDAAPLVPGWLQKIADGYYSQPMKFYGPRITTKGDRPASIPLVHMAGVAVYPNAAAHILAPFCGGECTWDLSGSVAVVPKMTWCPLIQHLYTHPTGQENEGWSFQVTDEKLDTTHGVPSPIREDAVLFHRCKDGSLIKCLRELRQATTNGNGNGHAGDYERDFGTSTLQVATPKRRGWPPGKKRGPRKPKSVEQQKENA